MTQWPAASASAASPAISSAYELVHSGLFTGKESPHHQPSAVAMSPAAASPPTIRAADRPARSQWPARTPRSVVPVAGSVLRMPSGS
jgi:hypothetical protein